MAASRLERLVGLLDNGSTTLVRSTAAEQLAQIQKSRPDELLNLLSRVLPHLQSKSWETRTAAAKAIGLILEYAEPWDPNEGSVKSEGDSLDNIEENENVELEDAERVQSNNLPNVVGQELKGKLRFTSLNIADILHKQRPLVGSAGDEYDVLDPHLDIAERLAIQQMGLASRLGVGGEYVQDELVNARDIAIESNGFEPQARSDPDVLDSPPVKLSEHSLLQAGLKSNNVDSQLSARQRNAMKRKAKMDARSSNKLINVGQLLTLRFNSTELGLTSHASTVEVMQGKTVKSEDKDLSVSNDFSITPQPQTSRVVIDYKVRSVSPSNILAAGKNSKEWPLKRLCDMVIPQIFDRAWEIRHGALMCLRDVIRISGISAGRIIGRSRQQNDANNQAWLEDVACRVCCLLALDRFGDFVSDQVIAPVRESASQALGSLIIHMRTPSLISLHGLLYQMVMQSNMDVGRPIWEVCHGGMLGLKYLAALKKPLLFEHDELMHQTVEAVIHGLADFDDDVRSISASTLLPITQEFVELMPASIHKLLEVMWDCIIHLGDDLSASNAAVMDLLSKLCSIPSVLEEMQKTAVSDKSRSFEVLVPLLYPFLRHTIVTVRCAVLRALLTFLNISKEPKLWVNQISLRLIFQNIVLERNEEVEALSIQVFHKMISSLSARGGQFLMEECNPIIPAICQLVFTPLSQSRHHVGMDRFLLINASGVSISPSFTGESSIEPPSKRRRKHELQSNGAQILEPLPHHYDIDRPVVLGDVDLIGMDVFVQIKIRASTALGYLAGTWPESEFRSTFEALLLSGLDSDTYSVCLTACIICEELFKVKGRSLDILEPLFERLSRIITTEHEVIYHDIANPLRILRSQINSLLSVFKTSGKLSTSKLPNVPIMVQGEPTAGVEAFDLLLAEKILYEDFDRMKHSLVSANRITATKSLTDSKETALRALEAASKAKLEFHRRVNASAAAALVATDRLPNKLNPLIRSLMDSLKTETNTLLQFRSAVSLAFLIQACAANNRNVAVDKLVLNLCAFLCVDSSEVPEFQSYSDLDEAIITVHKDTDANLLGETELLERESQVAFIERRGARKALEILCQLSGPKLFSALPKLKECIFAAIEQTSKGSVDQETSQGQTIVDGLSVLEAIVTNLDSSLYSVVIDHFEDILSILSSKYSVFRYAAAKCLATVCSVIRVQGIIRLIQKVVPMLGNASDLVARQGALECIYRKANNMEELIGVDFVRIMEINILPYVVFLVVPVLGRMSDSNPEVRLLSTATFATLIKLVPLEEGIPDAQGLPIELLRGREQERNFISQMLNPTKAETFEVPVVINAALRSYQQDGINWLAFLNKYQLHGILCDDMGLGKTLQSICIIASDHHMRAEKFKMTKAPEARRLSSLIICPPTICGHWQYEFATYAPFIKTLIYFGTVQERTRIRGKLGKVDVVITSYDVARNDADVIASHTWNYCVLDEGHIIKNPKAKLTQAVKRIDAYHRLILSGTPIQNNVLELWSLFDFLMPGFLGTERSFLDRFAKPITQSRNTKSSTKDQEAGALALEGLHKQVLPFLLRRLKEDVLSDLPPKIIQDYYCELGGIQKDLYEDFSRKQAPNRDDEVGAQGDVKQHVFQALQYMRKVCNHPALVLNDRHPNYRKIMDTLSSQNRNIHDLSNAPKLGALKDLLVDCGIGIENVNDELSTMEPVSQHRALIFCQLKEMVDMVEKDVLRKHLPGVSYIRMDGSTDLRYRHDIVQRFNSDPSIDVMLLTTHVGGLGLNLTGADTVIFVEHDWNPMKDLQAMDRAHRIGQKKVVNVYRLITRGTIEEKIMGLQQFKLNIASTVVNQQNAGLGSMNTDQIFDLFESSNDTVRNKSGKVQDEGTVDAHGQPIRKGGLDVLEGLSDLYDESQYDEYNLDNFIESLKK